MSVAMRKFHRTKELILGGGMSLVLDTVKLALLKPGFAYDNSMIRLSDVAGLELDQTLYYQTGGLEIVGKSVATNNEGKAEYTIGTVRFPQIDDELQHLVVYVETTVNGIVNPLICYGTFSSPLSFSSSAFLLSWPEPIIRW